MGRSMVVCVSYRTVVVPIFLMRSPGPRNPTLRLIAVPKASASCFAISSRIGQPNLSWIRESRHGGGAVFDREGGSRARSRSAPKTVGVTFRPRLERRSRSLWPSADDSLPLESSPEGLPVAGDEHSKIARVLGAE